MTRLGGEIEHAGRTKYDGVRSTKLINSKTFMTGLMLEFKKKRSMGGTFENSALKRHFPVNTVHLYSHINTHLVQVKTLEGC